MPAQWGPAMALDGNAMNMNSDGVGEDGRNASPQVERSEAR